MILLYIFSVCVHVHAESLQLCPTDCDPMDCCSPGSVSMGFSRQEYWSGLSCPLPGDLHHPGIKPASLMSPVLAGGFFTTSSTWEASILSMYSVIYIYISHTYLQIFTRSGLGN